MRGSAAALGGAAPPRAAAAAAAAGGAISTPGALLNSVDIKGMPAADMVAWLRVGHDAIARRTEAATRKMLR